MAIIVDPTNFNPSALTSPNVYLEVIPPQASIVGAPASISAASGTASWGPLNVAIGPISDINSLNNSIGLISAASLTDPYDLPTDLTLALNQAGQAGLTLFAIRVSDGSDTQASVIVRDSSADTYWTVTVGGSATEGDNVSIKFTAATFDPSETVSITVGADPTLSTVAGQVNTAINADSTLTTAGISSTHVGAVLTIVIPTALACALTNVSSGSPTETLAFVAAAGIAAGTLTALYSGVLGNQIKMTVTQGSTNALVNVLLTGWQGKAQEFYTNLPNTTSFWATLESYLANGQTAVQGASNLARFSPSGSPTNGPALNTLQLSGGTDGRADVTTQDLVGSSGSPYPTGLYAALSANPFPNQVWVPGLTDPAGWVLMQELCAQNGLLGFVTEPIDTTIATAISDQQEHGINSYEIALAIDWMLISDPINNTQRWVSPLGTVVGRISALSPEQAPLNKPVYGVLATRRVGGLNGNQPYTVAETGLANSNGILLVSNPDLAGFTFGFVTDTNCGMVTNNAQGPVEYSRLTNFLLNSVGSQLGQFIGQLQSVQPNDPLRANVRSVLNNFLAELATNEQIDNWNVTCDLTNNSPTTIAQHILNVAVQVRYLASVWFLVFQLQGGVTVSIQTSVIQPQPTQ
jgi:hypothetical protein